MPVKGSKGAFFSISTQAYTCSLTSLHIAASLAISHQLQAVLSGKNHVTVEHVAGHYLARPPARLTG